MWPTMMGTWAKWAPPNERSTLVGISNSGAQIGVLIAFSLGGFLCQHGFDGGWPSIFYIFGKFEKYLGKLDINKMYFKEWLGLVGVYFG